MMDEIGGGEIRLFCGWGFQGYRMKGFDYEDKGGLISRIWIDIQDFRI